MLNSVQFPAGVTNLDASLTDVERDDFPHDFKETKKKKS
jgi:hypothetical protein